MLSSSMLSTCWGCAINSWKNTIMRLSALRNSWKLLGVWMMLLKKWAVILWLQQIISTKVTLKSLDITKTACSAGSLNLNTLSCDRYLRNKSRTNTMRRKNSFKNNPFWKQDQFSSRKRKTFSLKFRHRTSKSFDQRVSSWWIRQGSILRILRN